MRKFLVFIFFSILSGHAFAADGQEPVFTVTAQTVPEWFVMDAQVEPVDQGTVSAQTSGRVSAIGVDVNDVVPEGHLLIEITNTSQTAGLDQAKAALKAAEARVVYAEQQRKRLADLIKKGSVAKREYDAALTESKSAASALKQAKAGVVQASENLGYTRITAPYAGVVSGRMVSLGETVNPGQVLLSGYSFERMRIVASLPIRYATQLQDSTPLRVTFPDGQSLMLSEHELFQFASPESHSFVLRANLPKQDSPVWKNGIWVKLAMPLAAKTRLLVPESALLRQNELSAVYVQESGHFILRQVRLGRTSEGKVEILSGLNEGESIALDAYAVLSSQGGRYAQ
ncbi:efflux RND transporter periplasmic adaptor subunit [Vibrio sp. HA2012]|uniref:efflux RND transporter periplasmic adaptor subunit n=1 Tax=Vibrio sp. HA2012 TaxID=1971595 RepID=UPI000C2BDAC4|nr:efflux RND transporter periplasmic adaptor subunit [Vibrio sp. HA2012]PJC86689.1 efflux RND transporter periplasmic adaptor subunit [Vibrio sp. HA2012]